MIVSESSEVIQPSIPDCGQSNEQSAPVLSDLSWTAEAISRLLGACDGYAGAIVAIKRQIGAISYHPINKRHIRRAAQREAILCPLRELLASLTEHHASCMAAYNRRSAQRALLSSTRKDERA